MDLTKATLVIPDGESVSNSIVAGPYRLTHLLIPAMTEETSEIRFQVTFDPPVVDGQGGVPDEDAEWFEPTDEFGNYYYVTVSTDEQRLVIFSNPSKMRFNRFRIAAYNDSGQLLQQDEERVIYPHFTLING